MFRTRRHALKHPASDTGKGYVKIGPIRRRGRLDFEGGDAYLNADSKTQTTDN